MAEQVLNDFLSNVARVAVGNLAGRNQADAENAQDAAQQQALAAQQTKLQQEQANAMQNRAFQYHQELLKSLTPENMQFMQQNGLLPQFQREMQGAEDVFSGRSAWQGWRPQFAFSDQTGQFDPGLYGGSPLPGAAPVTPISTAPTLTTPNLTPRIGMGGSAVPGAPPAPAPAATPAPATTAAAPPAPGRVMFGLTPAQNVAAGNLAISAYKAPSEVGLTQAQTARTTAEAEDIPKERLQKQKEFNLNAAGQQWNEDLQAYQQRVALGFKNFDEQTKLWTNLIDRAMALGGKGANPAAVAQGLGSLLKTASPLGGATPNAAAMKAYVEAHRAQWKAGGLSDQQIDAILNDPSLGGAPGGTAGGATVPVLPPAGPMGAPGTAPGAGAAQPRAELQGMQPAAASAAEAGLQAAQAAGMDVSFNSGYRASYGQNTSPGGKQSQAQLRAAYEARGRTGLPAAPPGHSTHEQGLAMDLSARNGDQAALAQVLAPYGWKWAGAADPVHFTYVGGGTAAPATPAVPAAPAAPAAPDQTAAERVQAGTAAVGVRTPAQAPPLVNPYPANSFGQHIWNMVQNQGYTPEQVIAEYAGSPEKQAAVQQIVERLKAVQQSNLMPGIPTPSQEGAQIPQSDLSSLYYTEPGVGVPQVTTTPLETAPLTSPKPRPGPVVRQTAQAVGTASREMQPAPAAAPAARPASRAAARPAAAAPPRPPVPPVPPPPSRRARPSLLETGPSGGGPSITARPAAAPAGQASLMPAPAAPKVQIAPPNLANVRAENQAYRSGTFGPAIARYLQKHQIMDPMDQRFYYTYGYAQLAPALIAQGVDPNDIEQHLDKYMEAHTPAATRASFRQARRR